MVRWSTVVGALTTFALLLGIVPTGLGAMVWAAQSPVQYEISFPNAEHHEAEISITYRALGPGPLEEKLGI